MIVNGGQLNYFRTLYSPAMLAQLTHALPQVSPRDQLGLARDSLSLAAASYQDYAPALDMLLAIPGDANALVAETAADRWTDLYDTLNDEGDKARLAALIHNRFFPRLQALGFDPREGESLSDATLRSELVDDFGKMGDPVVVAEARRRFALLAQDRTALDGELKGTWLSIIARNANEAEWDFLRKFTLSSTDSTERKLFARNLGTVKDDALAKKALELAMSGEVEPDEGLRIINSVAAGHPDMAFNYLFPRQDQLDPMLEDVSRPGYLAGLARTSDDPAMLARVEGAA